MIGTCTLSFLISIILLSALCVAETEVFDGEILSGESIDIDDFTFIITMNKYATAIFVDGGEMFQTIALNDCEKMEAFRICFDNTTYDEEDNELYTVIRILRREPDITILRTANETEIYVGKESQVTITMTNTGDHAEEVILTDDYPTSIEISEMDGGCRIHENQVYWNGHLDEGDEQICTFNIKALEEFHQSLVAKLVYWDGFKYVEEFSTTMTIDFIPVVEIFIALVREDYEIDGNSFDFDEENPSASIGETVRLIVNITNNYPDDIDVEKIDISLPPGLEYAGIGSLRFNYVSGGENLSSIWSSKAIRKINDKLLRWTGRINENDGEIFIIKLKTRSSGENNINFETIYGYDDLEFEKRSQEGFNVGDLGVPIRITVDDTSRLFSAPERMDDIDDSIDIQSLHTYRFTVYAQNANPYSELEDVEIIIDTDLADFPTRNYDIIDEQGRVLPFSGEIVPPYVEKSTSYSLNVTVHYTNEFGEKHTNKSEFDFDVLPFDDVSIEVSSSEGEFLESGEETEITVELTNDMLIDLRAVEVRDIIPEVFDVTGIHSQRLKLNKESNTDVYKYNIKVPVLFVKTRFNITTIVTFFSNDLRKEINFTTITPITVNPREPDLDFDMNLEEPNDIFIGNHIPVEYTIRNRESEETLGNIIIKFPIQEDIDVLGPAEYNIESLDPGEEITIRNIIWFRPKSAGNIEIDPAVVFFEDSYGNSFSENSSQDTIEVESAEFNGPVLFLSTNAPELVNRSTDFKITIRVLNNGSEQTDVTIKQGDMEWEKTVFPKSTEFIEYTLRKEKDDNYTIPDPVATYQVQGMQARTKGSGAMTTVKLMLGELAVEIEPEAPVIEEQELTKKTEMSFEEYDLLQQVDMRKKIMKYSLIALLAIFVIVLAYFYLSYLGKKKPQGPFMEGG
ncbi:hypothetical protein HQ545_08025 [Candidatus Woesearchaeota archaeon]|nr:hypothetical protein [Candidatus Woesearchaeota archaeon]